jgi:hypothetical protein
MRAIGGPGERYVSLIMVVLETASDGRGRNVAEGV